MEVVVFRPEHFDMLNEQDVTQVLREYTSPDHAEKLAGCKYAFTGVEEGRVLICAGLVEYWKDRAVAWAVVDTNCKPHFWKIHKAVKRFLEVAPYRRIEAEVDVDFEAGHRWAEMLGFTLEAPLMRAYHPNGRDCSLYAKVRD